jgi:hypothetical protein
MEFSVVRIGYDQDQVDSCLEKLGEQLARMAAQADAAVEASTELGAVRDEVDRLRGLLSVDVGPEPPEPATPARDPLDVAGAEAAAAEILARARDELAAAREEARLVRDQVYAEALQARRDFEAALHARRQREQQVDEILREVAVVRVPAEPAAPAATASTGVPATRVAAGGEAERGVASDEAGEPASEPRPVAPAEQGSTAPAR